MTINRADLMKAAWATVRRLRGNGESLRALLSRALKLAWEDAKQAVRITAYAAAQVARMAAQRIRPASEIRADILCLECKDRLQGADWSRLDALNRELRAAEYRPAF